MYKGSGQTSVDPVCKGSGQSVDPVCQGSGQTSADPVYKGSGPEVTQSDLVSFCEHTSSRDQ